MRISDWSSDVCSSDLNPVLAGRAQRFDGKESGESFGERRDQDQDRDRRAGAGLHLDRVDRHREVDNQPGGDAARRTEHGLAALDARSEEPTSELQSLMRRSYAVFCLPTKNHPQILRYAI